MPIRQSAQVETRYVAAFCHDKWPRGGYVLGYPLGPIPKNMVDEYGYASAANAYRPWRPEVDARGPLAEGIILIEGKVFKTMDALAKLRWYGDLVPQTEELRQVWGQPVQLWVVTPRLTPTIEALAHTSGVVLHYYTTPEIIEYLAHYERYWTPEYQRERAAKMQRRRDLGVE